MWRRKLTASIVKCSSSPCVLPGRCEDSPLEARVLRLGRREGGEVVRPGQQRRGGVQGVAVDRLRPPERTARLERGAHAAPEDPVAIGPRARREAGAEVVLRLLGHEDGDVVRQRRVERLGRLLRRRPACGPDARHLAGGVHAGVGAAGDLESVPSREDCVERLAHDPLDRALLAAAAPSRESRCRRTRASASGSFRPRARSLSWVRWRPPSASTTSTARNSAPIRVRLRTDARAGSRPAPARPRRRDSDLVRHEARRRRRGAPRRRALRARPAPRAERGGAASSATAAFPLALEAIENHMLNRDGDDHRRLRRLVTKAFTPKRVERAAAADPGDRRRAAGRVEARGEMDLSAEYAFPLPITVIAELLGVPTADQDRFKEWSDAIISPALRPRGHGAVLRADGRVRRVPDRLLRRSGAPFPPTTSSARSSPPGTRATRSPSRRSSAPSCC